MTKDALDAQVLAAVEAGNRRACEIQQHIDRDCCAADEPGPTRQDVGGSLQRLKLARRVTCKGMRWTSTGIVTLTVQVPRECEQNLRVWLAHNAGKVLR